MQHLIILPILIPLLTGVLLMLPPLSASLKRQRFGSILSLILLLATGTALIMRAAAGEVDLYALGDWPAPFGILLVLDRLSAIMLLLTVLLGLAATLYACGGTDRQGSYFHVLMQFQLMGLNGAFLTGDLFNLFVFFEVLLIASYALVIHGGGKHKTRANLHYVALNLAGSSLFLFALGILYGSLGTLNMADMGRQLAALPEAERPLAEVGCLLLLVVFGLKAAAFPLYFWLPNTYSAVSAPVAALFAIMTKIGVYSILRVHSLIFSSSTGELAATVISWLWPLAIATILLGAVGAMACRDLRTQTAYIVILSVGTLLSGIALDSTAGTTALLYYMVHTTLISSGLFLLVDLIAQQRGQAADRIVSGHPITQAPVLGVLYLIAAMAMIGMPPVSGFIGKALLLKASEGALEKIWLWPALLVSSLLLLIALARTGSTLFWRASGNAPKAAKAAPIQLASATALILAAPMLAIWAGPLTDYAQATAEQLDDPALLIRTILPEAASSEPGRPFSGGTP